MRFGTWHVRSLYRSGLLTAVAREVARYELDLVGVLEVRRDKGGTVRAGIIFLSMEKENKIINRERDFYVHYKIVSAVKGVEFVSDRTSYIVLIGRCCGVVVSNVHAPSEKKSDDSKDSFYEELQ